MTTATTLPEEIEAGLSLLVSDSFKATATAVKTVVAERFANLDDAAVAIEDVLGEIKSAATILPIPGLAEIGAIAGDIDCGIKVLMILKALGGGQQNGGVFGAFADSLNGVVRPVDNPSGAIGGVGYTGIGAPPP
jgi:predicted DNA-binding protein